MLNSSLMSDMSVISEISLPYRNPISRISVTTGRTLSDFSAIGEHLCLSVIGRPTEANTGQHGLMSDMSDLHKVKKPHYGQIGQHGHTTRNGHINWPASLTPAPATLAPLAAIVPYDLISAVSPIRPICPNNPKHPQYPHCPLCLLCLVCPKCPFRPFDRGYA